MDQLYNKYLSCGGRLTTDSRAIVGGEMFLALKGENFDGNEYALKALEQGAAYVVVNCGTVAAVHPQAIEVDDTFETLRALARHHRRQLRIPVPDHGGTEFNSANSIHDNMIAFMDLQTCGIEIINLSYFSESYAYNCCHVLPFYRKQIRQQ